ncbi:hypothetical protein MNBD_DELTA01-669 [hydrothermal vent metagenome]|uniref:Phosphate-specific outer membrane porin OprP Pyrophosphate-specific outer membrane porin OprO n=1 Tax=hydrothermal vent metagenome TaxID=652676 RepID=A0A3B0QMR6_9ZZZZ
MKRFKGVKSKLLMALVAASIVATIAVPAAEAGVTVYQDGDKYVKLGGRIQMQYHGQDPDSGSTTDDLKFRRLRPYIEGSLHKDWMGKFQWDMGDATGDNEIAIKDAYMQYKGFKNIKITLGNAYTPFSRETMTSSKYQQLVERTFVGDHNYGAPDRNLGVHVTGSLAGKKLTYGISAASASIDPDDDKLDFDTPVNNASDFNEGRMIGARLDYHPFGFLKMSQGDFSGDLKATIGVAAFSWQNDDDNNTYTTVATGLDKGAGDVSDTKQDKADIDSVKGFEISGAIRGRGASVDAQYNRFSVDTVDSTYSRGIFKNGDTTLTNLAVEGGYMVIPDKLEIVAAYQSQDADSYATEWTRNSVGFNYFFEKHDVKAQVTYRMGKDLDGIKGNDEDEVFVQAQYVF